MTANPADAVREALERIDSLIEDYGAIRHADALETIRAHLASITAQAEASARDAARWAWFRRHGELLNAGRVPWSYFDIGCSADELDEAVDVAMRAALATFAEGAE